MVKEAKGKALQSFIKIIVTPVSVCVSLFVGGLITLVLTGEFPTVIFQGVGIVMLFGIAVGGIIATLRFLLSLISQKIFG